MKFINSISAVAGLMVSAAALAQVPFNGSITGTASGQFAGTYDPVTYQFSLTGNVSTLAGGTTPVTAPLVHPSLSTIQSSSGAASGLTLTIANPGTLNNTSFNVPGFGTVYSSSRNQFISATGFAGGYPGATTVTLTFLDSNSNVLGTGSFTIVPEPETYAAAAALGLVGFGLWRRRNA